MMWVLMPQLLQATTDGNIENFPQTSILNQVNCGHFKRLCITASGGCVASVRTAFGSSNATLRDLYPSSGSVGCNVTSKKVIKSSFSGTTPTVAFCICGSANANASGFTCLCRI